MSDWIEINLNYTHVNIAEDINVLRVPNSNFSQAFIPLTSGRSINEHGKSITGVVINFSDNGSYSALPMTEFKTGWVQDLITLPGLNSETARILSVDTGLEIIDEQGLWVGAPIRLFELDKAGSIKLGGSTFDAFWHSGAVADVDNNGLLDLYTVILGGGNSDPATTIFEIGTAGNLELIGQANTLNWQTDNYSSTTAIALINANDDQYPDLFVGPGMEYWHNPPLNKNPYIMKGSSEGYSKENIITLEFPDETALDGVNPRILSYDKIRTGDINSDGKEDLILQIANDENRFLQILVSQTDGSYLDKTNDLMPDGFVWPSTPHHSEIGKWSDSAELVDANLDGLLDIVFTEPYVYLENIHKFIFLQNSDGTFRESTNAELGLDVGLSTSLSSAWIIRYWRVEDLDGDGISDFFFETTDWDQVNSQIVDPTFHIKLRESENGITKQLTSQSYLEYMTDNNDVVNAGLSGHHVYLKGGDDKVILNFGNYFVDGGEGIDSAYYKNQLSDYSIAWEGNDLQVTYGNDENKADTLRAVERLTFSDKSLAFDLEGNAGYVAKLLNVVFGNESLQNTEYVGIGLNLLDSGMSYEALIELALNAAGAATNEAVVQRLYINLVGSAPSSSEAALYVGLLDNGMSKGALGNIAADHALNLMDIDLVGLAQTGIEYI